MTDAPRFTAVIPAGGEYQFFTSIFAPTPVSPEPADSRVRFCMVIQADTVTDIVGPDHDIRIGSHTPTGQPSVMLSSSAQPRIATAAYPGAKLDSASSSMEFLARTLEPLRWIGLTPDRAVVRLAKHVTFDVVKVPPHRGVRGSMLALRSVVLFREYMADEIEAAHYDNHKDYRHDTPAHI